MRRARRIGFTVAISLMVVLAAPPAPAVGQVAVAEALSVTVSPATNLVDGDEVTVAGSGWTLGANLFVAVCLTGTDHCGGFLEVLAADASGDFSVSGRVRATFSSPDGAPRVDCRAESCSVLAVVDLDNRATAPLSFDPSAPLLPSPTISATPDFDLVDGQDVTVAGSGFLPGDEWWPAQCPATATDLSTCIVFGFDHSGVADEHGEFAVTVPVQARIAASPPVDCRVTACVLVASALFTDVRVDIRTPIAFDPDAPLAPTPHLAVSPSTGLIDGQVVTVHGTDFDAGEQVLLNECIGLDASVNVCDRDNGTVATAGADGTFERQLSVRPFFTQADGVEADCPRWGCVIRAYRHQGSGPFLDVPLVFDLTPSSNPLAATPIAVAPRFTG